jgi:hypothetical protein
MHPEMVTAFIDEFHRELNRQAAERDLCRRRATHELEKAEREIRRLIEAIKASVPGGAVKDEMATLEEKRLDLLAQVDSTPAHATAPSEPCRALPAEGHQSCRSPQRRADALGGHRVPPGPDRRDQASAGKRQAQDRALWRACQPHQPRKRKPPLQRRNGGAGNAGCGGSQPS